MPTGAKHEYKAVDLHDKSPEFVELYRKVVQDPAANAKVNDGGGRELCRAGRRGVSCKLGAWCRAEQRRCQQPSRAVM